MQQNLELRQWLRQLRREETLNSQQGEDAGLGLGEAHLGASRLCQRTPISVHGFNPDIPLFSTGTSKPHLTTVHVIRVNLKLQQLQCFQDFPFLTWEVH